METSEGWEKRPGYDLLSYNIILAPWDLKRGGFLPARIFWQKDAETERINSPICCAHQCFFGLQAQMLLELFDLKQGLSSVQISLQSRKKTRPSVPTSVFMRYVRAITVIVHGVAEKDGRLA